MRSRGICPIPSAVTIGKIAAQSEAEQKDWQKHLALAHTDRPM